MNGKITFIDRTDLQSLDERLGVKRVKLERDTCVLLLLGFDFCYKAIIDQHTKLLILSCWNGSTNDEEMSDEQSISTS